MPSAFPNQVHYNNEYLMRNPQMNLKGCLSSAQIFNAATHPIYPIF